MVIGDNSGIGVYEADYPENVVVMQVGVGLSARIGVGAKIGYVIPRGPRGLVQVHTVMANYYTTVVETIELETRATPVVRPALLARMVVAMVALVVVHTTITVTNTIRVLAGRVVRFAVSFDGRVTMAAYACGFTAVVYTVHRLVEIFAN